MKYHIIDKDGISYISNPDLSFVKDGQLGNIAIGKQFTNRRSGIRDSQPFSSMLKWQTTRNPQKQEKRNEKFRHQLFSTEGLFERKDNFIAFLGHATFLIQVNGVKFITDPVFTALPFLKRYSPFPIEPKDIHGIDHVLLSHGHMDHLDTYSIKQLLKTHPKLSFMGPLKLSELVNGNNATVQEAAWYQQFRVNKDIEITYLPAQHWHRRSLFDYNTMLWGSFWIRANGTNIYFAGDSGYNNHYKEIREVMGPADICIMPVGAYKPSYMMQKAHMSPEEAVQAFHDLEGKVFIPMHYGTFDLADEPIGEPYRLLSTLAATGGIHGKLVLAGVGEAVGF